MAASSSKIDPECTSDVVLVGDVQLHPHTEKPDWPQPHATALLSIDVLTSTKYQTITFQDVLLTLEIVATDATSSSDQPQFVGYSQIPNGYIWGAPSATDPTSWDESHFGAATAKLRIRRLKGVLLSEHSGDGLSYWIGVTGLSEGAPLAFTASASASKVTATAASCPIQVKDLHVDDRLPGPLS
ncbi:hypothetical protein ACGFYV_24650 [Streptomyces sp. NPDC048297]|uniref:hypothetical protein n=1 Tax=Streptomyces sp. NPDC048297 TaxID=3365531 RepID=UPI00372311CD